MASDRWAWDQETRRFRDRDSGRFLSHARTRELRGEFLQARASVTRDLAADLASGARNVGQWEQAMRAAIKETHVTLAALGGGGRNAMQPADWLAVGRNLKSEYRHLHEFAQSIAAGELSEAQIAARSTLYLNASKASFEQSRSARYGLPALEHYPGDGQDPCHGNCRCDLSIEETDEAWRVTWHTSGDANTCSGCRGRAASWNPLVISKDEEERAQDAWDRDGLVWSGNGKHHAS